MSYENADIEKKIWIPYSFINLVFRYKFLKLNIR